MIDRQIQKALGHYVYALIDPLRNEIFYVGKGSSNARPFDHLKSSKGESEKAKRIESILAGGKEPKIEILRSKLASENEAFEVEAAVIDSLGIQNLTNIARGHRIERGRMKLEEFIRINGSQPVIIKSVSEKCIIFFIEESYKPGLSEIELYDAARQYWGIGKQNRVKGIDGKYPYEVALAVYESVVIRVYNIVDWYPAGTTVSTRSEAHKYKNRFEFVGKMISNHKLLGKKLVTADGKGIPAIQKGFTYIN